MGTHIDDREHRHHHHHNRVMKIFPDCFSFSFSSILCGMLYVLCICFLCEVKDTELWLYQSLTERHTICIFLKTLIDTSKFRLVVISILEVLPGSRCSRINCVCIGHTERVLLFGWFGVEAFS